MMVPCFYLSRIAIRFRPNTRFLYTKLYLLMTSELRQPILQRAHAGTKWVTPTV